MVQRYWTKAGQTQQQIKLAVTEAMRGGFFVHVTYVRENRAYLETRKVSVPWKNKDLDLKWEHFVSKLQPGQKETWTLVISKGGDGVAEKWSNGRTNTPTLQHSNTPEHLVAELVATLYDESLDAFAPLDWPHQFSVFREDYSFVQSQFANTPRWGSSRSSAAGAGRTRALRSPIRTFPPDLTQNLWGYRFFARRSFGCNGA
jgi:hypothetical protein